MGNTKSGKKVNIDVKTILEHIDKGMLVGEIAELYGCSRQTISKRLKDNGYNMQNNVNQRERHSKLMKTEVNPTKGKPRNKEVLKKMIDGYVKMRQDKRAEKLKTGITYNEYCRYARYDSYVKLIPPDGFEIDHMFSLKDCWDNNVPLELVSHEKNLQFLTPEDNRKKSSKSSITLDEFKQLVGVQRLSKSQLDDLFSSWKKVE